MDDEEIKKSVEELTEGSAIPDNKKVNGMVDSFVALQVQFVFKEFMNSRYCTAEERERFCSRMFKSWSDRVDQQFDSTVDKGAAQASKDLANLKERFKGIPKSSLDRITEKTLDSAIEAARDKFNASKLAASIVVKKLVDNAMKD